MCISENDRNNFILCILSNFLLSGPSRTQTAKPPFNSESGDGQLQNLTDSQLITYSFIVIMSDRTHCGGQDSRVSVKTANRECVFMSCA